jgi:spore germination protein D
MRTTRRWVWSLALVLCSWAVASCGNSADMAAQASDNSGQDAESENQTGGGQQQRSVGAREGQANYPEVKAMVLDILHSKEGMDTLKDTLATPEFKKAAAVTQSDVADAVEKMLSQDKGKAFLSQQMQDPKFAAAFVTGSKDQMAAILQKLIKDPEYQQQLLTLMESPEFQKMEFTLFQSPEYRKEVMKIMTEALQDPAFAGPFDESMKRAVKASLGGDKNKLGQEEGQQQSGQEKSEEKKPGKEKSSKEKSDKDKQGKEKSGTGEESGDKSEGEEGGGEGSGEDSGGESES